MIAIGPYVVVREIPTRHGSETGGGKTYRATDRLTGIPVLLHDLTAMTGVPELPRSPSLLPFTDIVLNAGEAYLVTELPPNAVPARDPLQAARGALAGLATLHEHGLAHGNVNTAQMWSVDGPVRLAGGGRYTLNGTYTVARDLQDLAATLDDLGGLPPILALLRTEPERLSAQEALKLLQAGEAAPAAKAAPAYQPEARGVRFQSVTSNPQQQASLPNLDPLSLLNHSAPLPQNGSYVSQTIWTTNSEPSRSNTDPGTPAPTQEQTLPFKLDVAQWDMPEFMEADAPHTLATPAPLAAAPVAEGQTPAVSLGWADVTRPLNHQPAPEVTTRPDLTPPAPDDTAMGRQGRRARAAASKAFERLRADSERQRQLQEVRRDEVAAQLDGAAYPGVDPAYHLAAIASGEEELTLTETETPQERRRREHLARQEEEQLAEKLVAQHGPLPTPAPRPGGTGAEDTTPIQPRQLKSVKMRWDEKTNSWQKVGDVAQSDAPRAGLPVWLWPVLGLLALLLIFAAIRASGNRNAASSTNAPCCDVQFNVTGGPGQATISILNTTSKGQWKPGQPIGRVPGTLHLPGEGTYKLSMTSPGFTPATRDITVPTREAVNINLGQ